MPPSAAVGVRALWLWLALAVMICEQFAPSESQRSVVPRVGAAGGEGD